MTTWQLRIIDILWSILEDEIFVETAFWSAMTWLAWPIYCVLLGLRYSHLTLLKKKLNAAFLAAHFPVIIPTKNFLPSGLFGEANQCRNNRRWLFYTTDPVCPVWHSDSKGVILETCLVPQCHPNRKFQEWNHPHQLKNCLWTKLKQTINYVRAL